MARQLRIDKAEISIFPSAEQLHAAVADEFLRAICARLKAADRCAVALTGGGTAKHYYQIILQRLASERELQNLAWDRVHFFWGDERAVPPSDKDSNYRMAAETLLSTPVLARAHQHRIRAELAPAQAAQHYEAELRSFFGGELPAFDLLLLGMGPEGHTASLFPGTAGLDVCDRWVVENWVEKLNTFRITLTLPVLNQADEALMVADGAQKRDAVKQIFVDHELLPAARVQPVGRLLWYLDSAAGADLV